MDYFDKQAINIAESLIKHGFIMEPLSKKECVRIRRIIKRILKA